MAFQQSDLDAVNKAIGSGELEVRFADRSVRYRSIAELLQARDTITAELNKQLGVHPRRHIRLYTRSGW